MLKLTHSNLQPLSISHSLPLSFFLRLSLSLPLFASLSLFLSLSFFHFLSLSLPLSLCFCVSLSFTSSHSLCSPPLLISISPSPVHSPTSPPLPPLPHMWWCCYYGRWIFLHLIEMCAAVPPSQQQEPLTQIHSNCRASLPETLVGMRRPVWAGEDKINWHFAILLSTVPCSCYTDCKTALLKRFFLFLIINNNRSTLRPLEKYMNLYGMIWIFNKQPSNRLMAVHIYFRVYKLRSYFGDTFETPLKVKWLVKCKNKVLSD